MGNYEQLTYALKQLSIAQSFYNIGRLDAYIQGCGPFVYCDETFVYGNWYELLSATADFVDIRWDESATCERIYFSDECMRRYFAVVKEHADSLCIRLQDDPYYKDICQDVYDTLLDACPYNCCFRIVTQTHHPHGYGLSVWIYSEQFCDNDRLLNGILQTIEIFSHRLSMLEAQGLISTNTVIPFPEPAENTTKEAA